jgi:fatty-acyl-CoA synthase
MSISTLADIVRHQAAVQPARIALTFEDRYTNYAALDRRANQVANELLAAGMRPATRIAVLDKNHDSFFEIWFSAAKAKAVLVPVNWRLAAPEIAYLVSDAQAEMLFVGAEYLDTVARIRDQLTSVREVIVTDQDYPAWRDRQSAVDPQLATEGDDVCLHVYTSGTTSHPKGVQLTNDNLIALLTPLTSNNWAEWRAGDVSLVVMPLFHVAGSVYALCGLFIGARNVVLREVVPQQILDAIGCYRVTKTCLVPAAILFLLQCAGIRKADLSSLQLVFYGAAPIPVELLRNALSVFRCGFAQLYGLTEATAGITCLRPEEHADLNSERLLSCGRPLNGVEICVVDTEGRPLPPRQVGEIICRTAQIMKGYWNLPHETANVLRGGVAPHRRCRVSRRRGFSVHLRPGQRHDRFRR